MHLIELAPRMGPAGRELDLAAGGEPLKVWIAVNLNDAFEPLKMTSRPLGATIGTVEVDSRRRIGSTPRSIIAR